MKTILQKLLGTSDLSTYLIWFFLTFIGAFTAILLRAKLKYNTTIPYRWSLAFLLQHNLLNLIIGFLIALSFFRLSNLVLKAELNFWLASSIGFISNELALLFLKFSFTSKK